MIDTQRQRVFLAHIATCFVNHRQPIRVRVLAEADVCLPCDDFWQDRRQIFRRRLGRMLEMAVWSIP